MIFITIMLIGYTAYKIASAIEDLEERVRELEE